MSSLPGRIVRRIRRDLRKTRRLRNFRAQGIVYLAPNFLYFPRFSESSKVADVGCSYEADLSVHLMRRYGVTAYGVDPTRKHAPALEALVRVHDGRFSYLPVAVCAKSGRLRFHESGENQSGSIRRDHTNVLHDTITTYEVEGVTPGELIARIGATELDLLKLDIEGAEYELLGGIDLADLRPCKQIFVEFHHHAVAAYTDQDTREIVERFRSAGFAPYSVDDHNYLFDRLDA